MYTIIILHSVCNVLFDPNQLMMIKEADSKDTVIYGLIGGAL